jgi:phospholipid transport system substrate-binding protein
VQREALTAQFETLLVRTYSSALAAYRDQVITVLPVHMAPSDTEVTVRSQIRQSGAAPISIDLVQNYRTTFRPTIDQQGIDGLIAVLTAKNAAR